MTNTESYAVPRVAMAPSGEEFNVYCDESCHLEHDRFKAMSLGAVWCPLNKVREVNKRLTEIKERHGIKRGAEVKWTKVSPCNKALYMDLIDYFLDDDDLHFRGVVVPDKSVLRHSDFSQTHDQWYYKMYFNLLKSIFDREARYYVYIDIKDTHFDHEIIRRVQPIRSEEVQIMQLVDILTGAIAYRHNNEVITKDTSATKVELINRLAVRSGVSLTKTTLLSEKKVNLLIWQPGRM